MKNTNYRPKQSSGFRRQAEKIAQERALRAAVDIEAMSTEETRFTLTFPRNGRKHLE